MNTIMCSMSHSAIGSSVSCSSQSGPRCSHRPASSLLRQGRGRSQHTQRRFRGCTATAAIEESSDVATEEGSGISEEMQAEYEANYEAWLLKTAQEGEEGYAQLKDSLLKRTQRGGTFVTLYIFVVVNSPAALCTMIGALASYAYLLLLIGDVDRRSPKDGNPMREAEMIENPLARTVSKGLVGYMEALKPRLLVPVALCAAAWYYNQIAEPDLRLGLVEEGCLVLGFASYKFGLAIEIWESLKPKPKTREELMRMERPMLPQLEDVEDIRPDLKK